MKFYLKNRKNTYDAVAEYNDDTKVFVVLKGSCVSDTVAHSPTFHGARSVEKRRELFVKNRVVKDDVPFKSPSTAANFITGRSSDGCSLWKDKTGHSFKEVVRGK